MWSRRFMSISATVLHGGMPTDQDAHVELWIAEATLLNLWYGVERRVAIEVVARVQMRTRCGATGEAAIAWLRGDGKGSGFIARR